MSVGDAATSASCRAKIVGVDEWTDIALLKIDARGLPVLPWGDSSKLKVAEWVLAIGNPFQLNQTVTLGIVSALGRSLEGRLATYEDFIQTDAAINPGNSGGALVNARGELIGINTAIFSETGGYQGIGFAVPSNLARHVMDDLIKYGEVQRGTIPASVIAPLTTQIAEQLGAPNTRGALVDQMTARLRRLRRRPAPRRHHRQLQRHERSRTPRSSSGCCPTRRSGTTVDARRAAPGHRLDGEGRVTQATGARPTNARGASSRQGQTPDARCQRRCQESIVERRQQFIALVWGLPCLSC